MLDKQDLQAIKELIDESITASEKRTQDKIEASEKRTQDKIEASEKRTRDEIRAAENRWMVFYEATILPQIQLLADGHQNILDTLAPKSRVDNLEDDVIFLKSIVKSLMQEVSELKKAQ